MAAGDEPAVLEPLPAVEGPGAYPLTTVDVCGCATPLSLDDASRADYADFLDYAAGAGQVAGFELGALPIGYLPLPQALRDQAIAAAVTIRELQPPPPVPPPNAEVPTPSTITPSVAPAAESPPECRGIDNRANST